MFQDVRSTIELVGVIKHPGNHANWDVGLLEWGNPNTHLLAFFWCCRAIDFSLTLSAREFESDSSSSVRFKDFRKSARMRCDVMLTPSLHHHIIGLGN